MESYRNVICSKTGENEAVEDWHLQRDRGVYEIGAKCRVCAARFFFLFLRSDLRYEIKMERQMDDFVISVIL